MSNYFLNTTDEQDFKNIHANKIKGGNRKGKRDKKPKRAKEKYFA